MTWEYKTMRLVREDRSQTWSEEGDSYSKQLCAAAEGGWELAHLDWPWVVFRRARVEQEASPEGQPPVDMGTFRIEGTPEEYKAGLQAMRGEAAG